MKLGLHLYDFSWPQGASQLGSTLVRIAQTAEAAGFDRISTVDHVWQSHYLGGPEHEAPNRRQVKRRKEEFRQKQRGRQRDAHVR